MDEVAPDGSPVEVYLRFPADDTVAVLLDALPAGADVLDLGCGVGRIAGGLVDAGHPVTGIDNSPAMLDHARHRGVETVEAELVGLDLGRRFDVVLLLSHFVNEADAERRAEFWKTASRHVSPGGVVVIERFAAEWVRSVEPTSNTTHGVTIELHDLEHDGDLLHAAITYRLDGRSWTQRFSVIALDDDTLSDEAATFGLGVERTLDPEGELVLLRAM